jgi:hypothetical protein
MGEGPRKAVASTAKPQLRMQSPDGPSPERRLPAERALAQYRKII